MANIQFQNVTKYYDNFKAVSNLNLEIEDREFVCFVGPSGCGKTTSLRMLAGLEEISEGEIRIDDRIVNDVPAMHRDIAMVFQSYALYPHYTIYDNLAFGLRNRADNSARIIISLSIWLLYLASAAIFYGLSYLLGLVLIGQGNIIFFGGIVATILMLAMFPETKRDIENFILRILSVNFKIAKVKEYAEQEEEIKNKVFETAKLLSIESQLWKKPKQLSGGQRQRVALGRAIIRNPKAFLMDEPLSNLDAKLRVQMRVELQRLTKKLKVTTLYVTHDQIEAMTLGDRIAVMNEGFVNQVGTPDEVYDHPVNKFVAGFIGSPAMNFIEGQITSLENGLSFISKGFTYPIPMKYRKGLELFIDKYVTLGIRPEHIKIGNGSQSSNTSELHADIGVLEPIGSDTYVYLDFPNDVNFIVKVEGIAKFHLDDRVFVKFLDDNIHFFDNETTQRILPDGSLDIPQFIDTRDDNDKNFQ